jgi:hypothetical protein
MRVRPIAFAGARRCAAAIYFGGRDAHVELTSIADADLRGRTEAQVIREARACAVGVNAESAK